MPKLRAHHVIGLAIIGLLVAAAAPPASHADDRPARLHELLTDLPDGVRFAAKIVDLNTGRSLFELNAHDPLIPASNQKLLVMAAAADLFRPTDVFRTLLATRAGDLVIIGDGDPGLGDRRIAEARGEEPLQFLDRWAAALRATGRTHFPGDLVVDATIFDDEYVHPDWAPGDLLRWYVAPVAGLNLNDNCVELTCTPGRSVCAPARWSMFPPCSVIPVINGATTGGGNGTPIVGRRRDSHELILSGKVSKGGELQSVPVYAPTRFAATAIRERLVELGITVAGSLRFDRVRRPDGTLPADCRMVASAETALPDVLNRIGVNSQNFFAEALLKRLGYEWEIRQGIRPAAGTWANGRMAIEVYLQRLGCGASGVIADGSGLARSNRVTAATLVRVLTYMHRHSHRDMFIGSLAGNRTGGTLRRRLDDLGAAVFAKTGYIRSVRSLSGYVRTTDHHWYAFSVIFNGFKGSTAPYNRKHDEICRILAGETAPQP